MGPIQIATSLRVHSAVVPKNFASLKAVSAMMKRFPRTSSFTAGERLTEFWQFDGERIRDVVHAYAHHQNNLHSPEIRLTYSVLVVIINDDLGASPEPTAEP